MSSYAPPASSMNSSNVTVDYGAALRNQLSFFYNICAGYFFVFGIAAGIGNVGLATLAWRLMPDFGWIKISTNNSSTAVKSNHIVTFGLAFGEIMLSLGYVIQSIYIRQVGYDFVNKMSPFACMVQPFVLLMFLGRHITAWMMVCLGCERLMATKAPMWYITVWNSKKAWLINSLVLGSGALLTAGCVWFASTLSRPMLPPFPMLCNLVYVHISFTQYIYSISSIGCTVAIVFTIYAALKSYQNLMKANRESLKKEIQWRISRTIAVVVGTTFLLVAIPNFILLSLALQLGIFDRMVAIVAPLSHMASLLNSAANLPIYVIFNKSYRDEFGALAKKCGATVTPFQIKTIVVQHQMSPRSVVVNDGQGSTPFFTERMSQL